MPVLLKAAAYHALDLCSLGRGVPRVIVGERVRFPARYCRYYPRDYEPATFRFLRARCRPGDTVLDIGAHIGLFTVVMARLVGSNGRVVSFEPTPSTREILRRTIALNGLGDRVEVRAEAVTRVVGQLPFYCAAADASNTNSLVGMNDARSRLTVPATTVDSIAEQCRRISLLKIDVEGAEMDVLLGARSVFARSRPSALLSLHPSPIRTCGASLAEIWAVLQDYRLEVRTYGRPVEREWFCRQESLFDVELVPAG